MKICLITVVTFNCDNFLFDSPLKKEDSFCFTDNIDFLKNNNSWTIIKFKDELINFFINDPNLKTDCLDFNYGFLCKIPKTIQVKDYINLDNYDYVIYADHKFKFDIEGINNLIEMTKNNALLLQKSYTFLSYNNPRFIDIMWSKILDYRSQEYLDNIKKTNGKIKNEGLLEFLEGWIFPKYGNEKFFKINEKYIKENDKKYGYEGDCVWTGNIVYNMRHHMTKRISREFMEEIIKSRTPNCQVAFFYILKKYKKYINLIENPSLKKAVPGRYHLNFLKYNIN